MISRRRRRRLEVPLDEDRDVEHGNIKSEKTRKVGGAIKNISHETKSPNRRIKRRNRQSGYKVIRNGILGAITVFILLGLLEEIWYYWQLTHTSIGTQEDFPLATPLDLQSASVVVVTMHRGFKYWGFIGHWLASTKKAYCARFNYAYVDWMPPEERLIPLPDSSYHRQHSVKFDKLRLLLYLMETQPNITTLLWIDGDAVIANPLLSIAEQEFKLLEADVKGSKTTSSYCMIWAQDSTGANSGVFLLRNSEVTRQLIRDSLNFLPKDTTFADQAVLTELIHNRNETYRDCVVELASKAKIAGGRASAVQLQSRIRGPESILYRADDWILHLPNHNRWQLLSSLTSQLTMGTNKNTCVNDIQAIDPPNLQLLSEQRHQRYDAVRQAIQHAWKGYSSTVSPFWGIFPDDLNPLDGSAISDWLHHAATLHDSLDTLYLANLKIEYEQAVDWTLQWNLQKKSRFHPTKTFEYSLRVIGGLLGAYSVSGDHRLLQLAADSGKTLLEGPFAASPTVFPRPFDLLAPSKQEHRFSLTFIHRWASFWYRKGRDFFTNEHRTNSLAGVGSFGLEFHFLSTATGDFSFRSATDAIFISMRKYAFPNGMFPNSWNVMTGKPMDPTNTGLASGGDSFYEYLLKIPLWHHLRENKRIHDHVLQSMKNQFQILLQQSLPKHTRKFEEKLYPVDGEIYHHLLCFLPGLLSLIKIDKDFFQYSSEGQETGDFARKLSDGCHETYHRTTSGLGPEKARIMGETRFQFLDSGYYLRPEHIESLFILYRTTKDPRYQDMAWDIFQAIERNCKTAYGYKGLLSVDKPPQQDEGVADMPSYFLAETLKYFLLIFGPDDFLKLDEYVFTTEAHPLRVAVPDDCNKHE